jgi:molecular chaperone IbpA
MFLKHELVPFVNDMRKHVIGYDNLWDDLVHRTFDEGYPKDNIMRLDNTVIIELALAGFTKDDIEIERDGASLVVRGSKGVTEDDEDVTYVRRNIAYRSFTKSYTVGAEYKDIRARFQDGILSIHLEKEAEQETKQLVEIN